MSDILFQPLGSPIAAGVALDALADIDPRLTRTHYFDGRLLTAEDLTRDQIYLDQRLRELGRVLGSGITAGLTVALDRFSGLLTVAPGQAVTAAGRVLELGTRLSVNLGDRALIAGLNAGNYRRLNRALYAVVLRHADVATDIAEVFPKDLGARRGFEYALITESVQLGLVPLPLPLPEQSPLQIRAQLMRELLGNTRISSLLPEDGVALGLLAVRNDTPDWLDSELLRQPLRAEPGLSDLQRDLARQYETLLADVLSDRASRSLSGDFHAADYFSLLPPAGTIPKAAIDPATGRQGYFPEHFSVAIAPIRQADLALIQDESLGLPPIDLNSPEPVDIMILAPLSNQEYGHWAAQLEQDYDPATRLLPQPDLLRLKLYPRHIPDLDSTSWTNIWARIGATQARYVRRPSRAAETGISAIVVALGSAVPEPALAAASPADSGGLIQDSDSQFLAYLSLATLAQLRPPADDAGSAAIAALTSSSAGNATAVQQLTRALLRLERQYDALVWPTLASLSAGDQLEAFIAGLLEAPAATPTPAVVAALGATLGLDATLLNQWSSLVA